MPNPDNLYTPIERKEKEFKPLKVPKSLSEQLPYSERPYVQKKLKEQKRVAVIKEPHEKLVCSGPITSRIPLIFRLN